MFKHIFLQIGLLLLLSVLVFFIVKHSIISSHKLYLDNFKVKYVLHDSDSEYLKKYGQQGKISQVKGLVFFTTTPWSLKNNNYYKFNGKYCII